MIFRFQSTLPRGERPEATNNTKRMYRFQSTLPRGERLYTPDHIRKATAQISIHAPARGATPLPEYAIAGSGISIHAPARGATSYADLPAAVPLISIHAPARGATLIFPTDVCAAHISIHAPARGATSILSKIHPMFLTISHNASSFSSFPFHSFLPHLLNSSTFCALFQVRISRAFSVYYRFAPKKSTPDL